jgi:hypothetical protein
MFALYKELKMRWKKIVRAVWKTAQGTEAMPDNLLDSKDVHKDVTKAVEELIAT